MSDTVYEVKPIKVTLSIPGNCEVRYTLDDTLPTQTSSLYSEPVEVEVGKTITARAFRTDSTAYLPSFPIIFHNYMPKVSVQEVLNTDTLVGKSGTINNDFYHNWPLRYSPDITKMGDTYFMYFNPHMENKYIPDQNPNFTGSGSYTNTAWDLSELYLKSFWWYSKDSKTWSPIPGFENDFTSGNARGKFNSKFILDLYYYKGKYHIVYCTINPEDLEHYITTDGFTENAYNNSSFFPTKEWKFPNNSTSLASPAASFTGNSYDFEVYEEIREDISTITTGTKFFNSALNKVPEIMAGVTSNGGEGKFSSEFIFMTDCNHCLLSDRVVYRLQWGYFEKTGGSTPTDITAKWYLYDCIVQYKDEEWSVIEPCDNTGYSTLNNNSSTSNKYLNQYAVPFGLLKNLYSKGYACLPYVYSSNSNVLGSRNIDFEEFDFMYTSSYFMTGLVDVNSNFMHPEYEGYLHRIENGDLYYWTPTTGSNVLELGDTLEYSSFLHNGWELCLRDYKLNTQIIPIISQVTKFPYRDSLNKIGSLALTDFIGYKTYIQQPDSSSSTYRVTESVITYPGGENWCIVSLYSEDNKCHLFRIQIDKPDSEEEISNTTLTTLSRVGRSINLSIPEPIEPQKESTNE